MKMFFGVILLALLFFALALVGAMAWSGNLNKESLKRLLWNNVEAPAPEKVLVSDDLSQAAKALREREEELNTREASIEQQQQRLNEMRSQMEELRDTLEQLIAQVTRSIDEIDADEVARLQDVANSLAEMKPDQAALALEEWPPDQAARLLQLIDERSRGKILDEMNEGKAAEFLQAMAEIPATSAASP